MTTLYIFLDEGGNLDFSVKGSKYFCLTGLTTTRNWTNIYQDLDDERYKLIEYGIGQEYFHCCEDNKYVKERIFEIIKKNFYKSDDQKINTIVVEKNTIEPNLQEEMSFYPAVLTKLLQGLFLAAKYQNVKRIIIITDQLPLNRKRKAIEKTIKKVLATALEFTDIEYRIFHHSSKSHFGLQITDYCNWAIFRKWERNDEVFYNKIKPLIKVELECNKSLEGIMSTRIQNDVRNAKNYLTDLYLKKENELRK